MASDTIFTLIEGPFQLGKPPAGFRLLCDTLARRTEKSSSSSLSVEVTSPWFDISMLSCFIAQLRNAKAQFATVKLSFPEITGKQMGFLWDVGFWQLIGANAEGSNLVCQPDPWRHAPSLRRAANFTPCLLQQINLQIEVKQLVAEWESHLQNTIAFSYVKDADAVQSREYLFLLLWELLQNANEHSQGGTVIAAGQIFVGKRSTPSTAATEAADTVLIRALRRQHRQEIINSSLKLRAEWLAAHERESFLIISCADDGIGIPASIQSRSLSDTSDDASALAAAFDPATSTRMGDESMYDVHGLSQVLRLARELDGYLFVQSGSAALEWSSRRRRGTSLSHYCAPLPGSVFQVILPLSDQRQSFRLSRGLRSTSKFDPSVDDKLSDVTLIVFEELGSVGLERLRSPETWPEIVSKLIQSLPSKTRTLYLDLVCMPRHRQFVSYLLRTIRKRFLDSSVVVVNPSPEVRAILSSLIKLDRGVEITDEESVPFLEIDRELSTVLSRGESGWCLPLLIPVATAAPHSADVSIAWIGLSGMRGDLRSPVRTLLNYLFFEEAEIRWEDIAELAEIDASISSQALVRAFKSICHCNAGLLAISATGCRLTTSAFELYRVSYRSLLKEIEMNILPRARHVPPASETGFAYSFGWRRLESRFRKYYYRTWDVLNDPNSLNICADFLVRSAFFQMGETLFDIDAVVAVTPSAGLLGRRIAERLSVPFWEAPSIYDIEIGDWLQITAGEKIAIVDDMLDLGTMTQAILALLTRFSVSCVAIITLLESKEGARQVADFRRLLVKGTQVELGELTEREREETLRSGRYYEIDPHSLEPISSKAFSNAAVKDSIASKRKLLHSLCAAKSVVSGHFVQWQHHYDVYFNLAAFLSDPSLELNLFEWMRERLIAFLPGDRTDGVTVVYPYFSPIHQLIRLMQSGRHSLGVDPGKIEYVVAKPVQRSADRLGYTVRPAPSSRYVVFLDDGIGTGGTLASVIDELIDKQVRGILALIVFDRIGSQPRKHLRRIRTYKTNVHAIPFAFETFVSTNLRSYFEENCPECRVYDSLEPLGGYKGIVSHSLPTLQSLAAPNRVPFIKPHLPSRLPPEATLDVIMFRDAVFSDTPSGREIARSLDAEGKSPAARADMLSTILMDRKLDRQICERERYHTTIHACLTSAKMKSTDRALFVLRIPFWHDSKLAYDVLTNTVPVAFAALAKSQAFRNLDDYFNDNLLEFCANAAALFLIRNRLRQRPPAEEILRTWKQLFRNQDSPYGSVYLFEFNTLFARPGQRPLEHARFLIQNFSGSFARRHDEALVRRIRLFLTQVRTPDHTFAKRSLPRPLLQSLLESIRTVQDHLSLTHFANEDFSSLLEDYTNWEHGGSGSPLQANLRKHFRSPNPLVRTTTIQRLIEAVTPDVRSTIAQAIARFKSNVAKKAVCLEPFDDAGLPHHVYALCPYQFLFDTLVHLLMNPVEGRCGKQLGGEVGDLWVCLACTISLKDDTLIEFRITDNSKTSSQAEIDSWFVKSGGLSAQRSQIRQFEGDLRGYARDNGENEFVLEVRRAYPTIRRE